LKKIQALIIILFLVLSSSVAFAGLGDLIRLGRNQAQIKKSYDKETKAYNSVKSAVEKGKIVKGQSKDKIVKLYGEPVITLSERGSTREKWYYKKASASFFGGTKIILFFDVDGILDEIKTEDGKD